MIMKQFDASDVPGVADDVVGFVESFTVSKQSSSGQSYETERYTAVIYQRPVTPGAFSIAGCQHNHVGIDRAARCCRGLLRRVTRERQLTAIAEGRSR